MIEMALTLEVALKALFLLLLTYALAWGYRRRSAAERHRIWSLGLANQIEDSPSYNSVRVIMGILEDKGLLTHKKDGRRYLYRPKRRVASVKRSAMRHLLNTFFQGSTPMAVSAFIDMAAADLTDEELAQLAKQIRLTRKENKP